MTIRPTVTRGVAVAALLILTAQCSSSDQTAPGYAPLNATLWAQQSAEYWAGTTQIFSAARRQLDVALSDPTWTAALEQQPGYESLPPAVILDVDDTVLESTVYTAQRMRAGDSYTFETWAKFVEAKEARPVPGSLDFCLYAESIGISVFFVTNNDVSLTDAVTDALRSHGYPVHENGANVITRTDIRDKSPRRKLVADGHRVLLLLGDDGNDFASNLGRDTREARLAAVSSYADNWGTKWFMLPNPMYGSWESALYSGDAPEGAAATLNAKLEALEVE